MESLDSQGMLLNFCCDMAAGLQELHQNNFVHRSVVQSTDISESVAYPCVVILRNDGHLCQL